MISINCTGRVTADLEPKVSSKGTQYLRFNLAVNKGFGEKQKVVFLQCLLTGENQVQRMVNASVKKGSLITVAGDLDVEEYDKKDGSKGTAVKVTLYDWIYTPSNKAKNENSESQTTEQPQNNTEDSGNVADDDLPF